LFQWNQTKILSSVKMNRFEACIAIDLALFSSRKIVKISFETETKDLSLRKKGVD